MKDFDKALKFVLKWEGGYSNDPNDPGGETKYGISKRSYPELDISKLTLEQAKDIFIELGARELIKKVENQLKNIYGVRVSDCSAKIFGGAKILQGNIHNIGMDNDAAVRAILKDLGIRVGACKTGGEKGYKLKFNLETGAVACQIFGEQIQEF